MKLAVAITLYDKFEEMKVLIDIIRQNWQGDYIITVCSNHPDAAKHMKGVDCDAFVQGEDITFSPTMEYFRKEVNLTCRILDGMTKSCTAAHTLGATHVMHLHTDAWPLKEAEVLRIVKEMQKKKVKFAARGMGLGQARPDCPLGHLDDMFFIYEVAYAKKVGFFEFQPLELLPDRMTIHGCMSLLVVGKIGLSKFWLYENHTKQIFWDGVTIWPMFERGKPMMFDEARGFLHVHSQSYPGQLSYNMQAFYLKRYGLTKGKHITRFLKAYAIPEDVLFRKLNKLEKVLDRQLRLHGYFLPMKRFGRDFDKKLAYIKMPFSAKLRYLAVNTFRYGWAELLGKRRIKLGKYYGLALYPEVSVWPKFLGEQYKEKLPESDYPEDSAWFVKNTQV